MMLHLWRSSTILMFSPNPLISHSHMLADKALVILWTCHAFFPFAGVCALYVHQLLSSH